MITTDTTTAKFHTSLNVSNLESSVAFYRVLLGQGPAKCKRDYAKFELEQPPVVLSLIPGRAGAGGNLNHLGLRVPDAEVLVQIQARLEAAGIRTTREEGVECCYAKQTKFWVTDPDRTLWELYVFHEDTDEHGEDSVPNATQVQSFARDVPREKIVWQHQIAEPVPARIPHDDNSVHEVLLEGTANLKPSVANLDALLVEARRVLRPGAEVHLHGLAADAALPDTPFALPGPAAAVQYVPAVAEIEQTVCRAGFVEVRFQTLSAKAYFEIADIGLREVLLTGRKPGHRPRAANHAAVYLGPLARVADDFGNVFPRGERVPMNIHDWQVLSKGPVAAQFLFHSPTTK